MLISVCQQNENEIYKIYYMMYDKKKLFKKLLELLDDEIISKQIGTVNSDAQDFPVPSEVYIMCDKDVAANLIMRILLKEDAAKYLIEENVDATADGDGDGDAPISKNNFSHYSRGHSSLRSAIVQCTHGLIIVECCSTKPSVMGISAAIQETWPDQADQASALVAPALILVAAGATGGKDAAAAVCFFDQERDRKSLMNDFIYLASANKSSLSLSLAAVTFSTSNVEREMMCDSDQDGGGSACSVCTLLLTFVRTSEETSLEGMTKVVTKLPYVGGDCCGSSSSLACAEDSYSQQVMMIEDDVFLSGNLAAAKESPLGCNDDASFLTNRIKERVVMLMVSFFFFEGRNVFDSRLDSIRRQSKITPKVHSYFLFSLFLAHHSRPLLL